MKVSVITNLNKSFLLFAALYLNFSPLLWADQVDAPLLLPKTEAAIIPSRQSILTMKDIGASRPIELRGVNSNAYLSLGVRLDEVVTKAKLHLNYTLSPALLPSISHLKVYLNDEVLATLPVTKESPAGPQKLDVELDPRFFTDFNKLHLQFIGHYTNDCEFPLHSSLWANISNTSTLEINLHSIALRNDLALLPTPFFDQRDNRLLTLPFVFATKPSLNSLRAAGSLASWFGALASYRGARFPAYLNRLPERYGVVFAANDERPEFLAKYPKVDAPTISLIQHPENPTGKLLLILGRNAADLQLAADALALGKAVMTGTSIAVKKLEYPPRRIAYDAPNWLQSGRPIPLGQLVNSPADLQRQGQPLEPILINARLPADLFTWEVKGIPIDLKYRYTPPAEQGDANLRIEINDQFIEAIPLLSSTGTREKNHLILPILDDGFLREQSGVMIPAFHLGSNNQLQFSFSIPSSDNGRCKSSPQENMRAAIDPDSTLDLSHFYHYAAMPNLAFFANSGFPFTKYADLAETAIVIPDQPNTFDMEAMFALLGHMGRSTGVPALHFKLIQTKSIQSAKDSDLLVIASGANKDLLASWGKSLPTLLEEGSRTFTPLGKAMDMAYDWFGMNENKTFKPGESSIFLGSGPLAAIIGFESPLSPSRSVVALTANTPTALTSALDALSDGGKVQYIRGDIALMRGGNVESYRVNDVYYVGELPWWRWIWFHLHHHPLFLTTIGIAIGLFVALLAFGALRSLAARRLGQHKK
ncbi:MAG: cellulose biosynthesis cyclic di-GMP-binding regulatory protein BcsB [Candidatus Nitrotoga sp.]|nr:cellulose biosynthesis cyclic di-GMP-binding regulatory protein BcsB [Candidatus Nitrotoga sp.]MDO9447493.1 cellulose biosynthesis cyclic di-GMP-binding regulatory protein BcsB [Candidatus Nitrotoga sp.]